MRYLNLGCGYHYSLQQEWTNIDFVSTGQGVIAHNLLKGIPFADNTFSLVYHSHVLEHFEKEDGALFVKECFRVLKPGGILRIAVPDLEAIVRNYIRLLDESLKNPTDELAKANYEWILLEMYDQTVRNYGGGNMGKYLFQKEIINEDFVLERLGDEARQIRKRISAIQFSVKPTDYNLQNNNLLRIVKKYLKEWVLKKLNTNSKAVSIGNFRLAGEIHQWMYDRYSLSELLASMGGEQIKVMNAFTSFIENWHEYQLDVVQNNVRKPDSLFIESIK